jgi:HD domain
VPDMPPVAPLAVVRPQRAVLPSAVPRDVLRLAAAQKDSLGGAPAVAQWQVAVDVLAIEKSTHEDIVLARRDSSLSRRPRGAPYTRLVLGDRFDRAVVYAVDLHRAQLRKQTQVPYVAHLFAVCSLVLEDGGTEDEAIAALLHDGPEDQGGIAVLDEIRARFGDEVATLVAALSDAMPAAGEQKAPWRQRKEAYLGNLADAPESVLRISLADKLHNAGSILTDQRAVGDAVWERFHAGRAEQAWYFRRLLALFERSLPGSRNLAEFRRVVGELFG